MDGKYNTDMVELKKGDCFELMRGLGDGSVDLIITDPPYDIHTDPGVCTSDLMSSIKNVNDDLVKHTDITKGYDIRKFGEESVRIMKNINIYFWCSKKQIVEYLDFWVKEQKCKFDILFWRKSNPMPTYNNKYLTDVEYCLYFHRNAYLQPQCFEDASLCFFDSININDKKMYGHPTIKPLHMIERLVRNSSRKGETILDPFMGSGTTAVACIRNGGKVEKYIFKVCV